MLLVACLEIPETIESPYQAEEAHEDDPSLEVSRKENDEKTFFYI